MMSKCGVLGVAPAALVALLAHVAPAGADGVYSGACTLVVDATFSTAVGVLPAPTTIELAGSGTCAGTGGVAAIRLRGTVGTTQLTGGFSCAGGVATGTGAVEVDFPGFVGPEVQLTVVEKHGAVLLTAVATSHPVRFDGVAVLAQDALGAAACPVTGLTETTWTGAMGFQDPEPPASG